MSDEVQRTRATPPISQGRIVLFTERNPQDEEAPHTRPAMVLDTYPDTDDDQALLQVFDRAGFFIRDEVPYDGQDGPGETTVPRAGTWHYPPRVS